MCIHTYTYATIASQADVILTPGNEGLVHHIVVYSCWNITQQHMVESNQTEGVCYTEEMPEFFESCRTVAFAWAIGGTVRINSLDVSSR